MTRLVHLLVAFSLGACVAEDGYRAGPPAAVDEVGADKADGTWETAGSLDGLAGTYARGTFGALPLLSLRVDGDDRAGTYEAWWRAGLGQRFETGGYTSIEENAALGFAAITLVPDAATPDAGTIYAIRRLQREGAVISRLELQMIELPYLKSTLYRIDE